MDDNASPNVGCAAVNDHISRTIPQTLWHYTTFAGFQGIFNSKKIWATEYRFLNDREEFNHAKKLAKELIEMEPEFAEEMPLPVRDTLRKSVDVAFNSGPLGEQRLRVMVASFSERGDQLSQWRGYSGDSTGVSIGLDLRGLRSPANTGSLVTLAPCVYREEKKRALLKAVFAHFRTSLQESYDTAFSIAFRMSQRGHHFHPRRSKKLKEASLIRQTALMLDLLRIGPLLKNEHFSEEKEWRLVVPSENIHYPTERPIEFRPIHDTLIPYIAYPLLMPNQDGEIPCRGIILGPGSHASAGVGVELFLQSKFIPISAQPSKIPYRPT